MKDQHWLIDIFLSLFIDEQIRYEIIIN